MSHEPLTFSHAGSIIVAGFRTAVTKSKKEDFVFTRPDDLAVDVIKGLLASVPQLDPKRVDDVIVGNAVPEAKGFAGGRLDDIRPRRWAFTLPASRSTGIVPADWNPSRWPQPRYAPAWPNVSMPAELKA